MHTIDHKQLVSFLSEVAFDLDQPVMVWGQPGVGKSDAVRQMAEAKGAVLVDIRLSQYDSVDLRGIPSVESGLTRWNMPATLPFVGNPDFPTDRPIVVFFDEINGAAPAVAGVAYQLVLDRAAGEHKLLPNVRIVAAGNREGDKGVTNKMPLPLANRFAHLGCVSMTLEMPFKDHDSNADPLRAWSPARCRQLARDCLAVLAESL